MTRGVPAGEVREGWWYRASQVQKLAQVDGGISLGMTGHQVAMNCGTEKAVVESFANYQGRHFNGRSEAAPGGRHHGGQIVKWINGRPVRKREANIEAAKDAFISGDPVDFWSVR